MLRFLGTNKNVVAFVEDLNLHLNIDLQSIIVMRQGKYAACSVSIATNTSLAGIVNQMASVYWLKPLIISIENTQGG